MQDSVIENQSLSQREQQFKELFLSEYGRMYKAAYILLGNEDEAKDAVQDVFAKLWTDTHILRKETTRTFLLTCIRNRCLNIIARKNEELKVMSEQLATALSMAQADSSFLISHSSLHDEEIIEAVNRYVDEQLTPQTSRVIKMHFDENQSYKDISNKLGISLSAVNKHIVQGLRKLRSTFKDREA